MKVKKYVGAHSKKEAVDLFARHVSSGKVRFFQSAGIDFVLGRREGPYLWDVTGEKKVIDCHCNGGVFNLAIGIPRSLAPGCRAYRNWISETTT